MAHHHHHHHPAEQSSKRIGIAFLINLSFSLIELVGGLLTNSVAILADAVHDLGDSMVLGLSWYFEKISLRQRDERYTYGYRRWSVAAAVCSSLVLMAGSVLILSEAVPRLWQPQAVHVPGMLGLAALGILANGLAFWKLHSQDSVAEKAVRLHLLEDVLGWVVVLFGSLILLVTDWLWLDPLMSILVSLFILRNVYINIQSFSRILLQAVPENVDIQLLTQQLKAEPQILSFHDLHLWTLDNSKHVLSIHLVVANEITRLELLELKKTVRQTIRHFGIEHDTLEIEYADETCQLKHC